MIQVEDFRERAYPWGSVDIENQVQKDFIRKPHKKVPIVYPITKTLLLELMGHQNFFEENKVIRVRTHFLTICIAKSYVREIVKEKN